MWVLFFIFWLVTAETSMSYDNFPFVFFLPTSLITFWSCSPAALRASRWLPHHVGTLSQFSVRTGFTNPVCIFLSHIKILITSQVYAKLLVEIFKSTFKNTVKEHFLLVFTCQSRSIRWCQLFYKMFS